MGLRIEDWGQSRSQDCNFGGSIWGLTNEWPKASSGGVEIFRNFCLEMVQFGGEKVTNAVHHRWFSGVTVNRLT